MEASARRLLVVVVILIACVVVVTIALRRSNGHDATYRARLSVQTLPPCAIDVLVPVAVDERFPESRAGEMPLAVSLFERDAAEWDSETGDLIVSTDEGPVEHATFVADDGRSLDFSRPKETSALARPTDQC